MDVDRAVLRLRLQTRRVTAAVVRRLPVTVADHLRGPVTAPQQSPRQRFQEALLRLLCCGGIPAAVTSSTDPTRLSSRLARHTRAENGCGSTAT